jgi:hypothetical protein
MKEKKIISPPSIRKGIIPTQNSVDLSEALIANIPNDLRNLEKNIKTSQEAILFGLNEMQANNLRNIATNLRALNLALEIIKKGNLASPYIPLLECIYSLTNYKLQGKHLTDFGDARIYEAYEANVLNLSNKELNATISADIYLLLESLKLLINSAESTEKENSFPRVKLTAESTPTELLAEILKQTPHDPNYCPSKKEELITQIKNNISQPANTHSNPIEEPADTIQQKSITRLNRWLYASLRFFKLIEHIPKKDRSEAFPFLFKNN